MLIRREYTACDTSFAPAIYKEISPLVEAFQSVVEVYAGGETLLFHLPEKKRIIYNDLEGDVVNVFRCLQDVHLKAKLEQKLLTTLHTRRTYRLAREERFGGEEDIKATLAGSALANEAMSFEPNLLSAWAWFLIQGKQWFNVYEDKAFTWLDILNLFVKKFSKAQLDCRNPIKAIKCWDKEGNLFFVDPPYLDDNGTATCNVIHHEWLVDALLNVTHARVVFYGYNLQTYYPLSMAKGWRVHPVSPSPGRKLWIRGSV